MNKKIIIGAILITILITTILIIKFIYFDANGTTNISDGYIPPKPLEGSLYLNSEADTQTADNFSNDKLSDSQLIIDTNNWETYRNDKYGFEIKYPPKWNISEKILRKKDIQNSSVRPPYIAKEFENTGLPDRIEFYSINIGNVSFVPLTFLSDKSISTIQCEHDSVNPCFNKVNFGLEKTKIDGKEAYIRKFGPYGEFHLFLKDLPKNWGSFNGIYFENPDSGNLNPNDNAKIAKIFEEMLKSIHFFN
ncbi:MAG TPA: hypothetical protein PLB52_03055 [Candidatus Moranbacteria bacterium]|nr:hypothetical protein [Candidatus Moranbacteria bacterium]